MNANGEGRIALLWHGEPQARAAATLETGRLSPVAQALRSAGLAPEPAVYCDELVNKVRQQLLGVNGVLVWVNHIEQGRDRTALDTLLREVADHGVFVSAHPDIIRKLGTKDVLFRTREMSWGCDTHRYGSVDELRDDLP